jgi:hypothetical protein
MKEFKGTKGKWQVTQNGQSFSIHKEEYEGLFIDCWGGGIANTSDEQAKANALLISKAPEMLEMLKECLKFAKMKNNEVMAFEIEKLIIDSTKI